MRTDSLGIANAPLPPYEIEATPALDKLAHLLQTRLDKVDGEPSRSWAELSEPERDFFRGAVTRLLAERALVSETLNSFRRADNHKVGGGAEPSE